MKTDDQKEIS